MNRHVHYPLFLHAFVNSLLDNKEIDISFVVLSDRWNGHPTSAMHLFTRIARQCPVVWMNTITRFPKLSTADAVKVCQTLSDWGVSVFRKSVGESEIHSSGYPYVLSPFMLPSSNKIARQINRLSLDRAYQKLQAKLGIASTIVLTTVPSTADFFCHSQAAKKIYYCVDDWSNYPGLNPHQIATMEEMLVREADGIIYTSTKLAEKNLYGRPSLYMPHGVDFTHFDLAHASNALPIEEMESIPKPIVGFFGLLSEWVDLELIVAVAKRIPTVSFVLIGRAETNIQLLSGVPNIHYVGGVPYSQLPLWARYFDVGLIPFKINSLTEAVNPLKLYEYYALGLPVVSTALPEVIAAEGPRMIAQDADEFEFCIRKFLSEQHAKPVEYARKIAQNNTWDERAKMLQSFVAALP